MSEQADKPSEPRGTGVSPVSGAEHVHDASDTQTPNKRKRRRFSFSLRTLMIAMLLFGVVLAPLVGLKKLKALILGGTQVSDLAPLAGLENVMIWLDEEQNVTVSKELEMRVERRTEQTETGY